MKSSRIDICCLAVEVKYFARCKSYICCKHLLISESVCQFTHCLPGARNLRVTRKIKHRAMVELFVKTGLEPVKIHNEMLNVLRDVLSLIHISISILYFRLWLIS